MEVILPFILALTVFNTAMLLYLLWLKQTGQMTITFKER